MNMVIRLYARILPLTSFLAFSSIAIAQELKLPTPPVAPKKSAECSRFSESYSRILEPILERYRATKLKGDIIKAGPCCARANAGVPFTCNTFESVAQITEQLACIRLSRDEAVDKCRDEVRRSREEVENERDQLSELKDYARELEDEARKQIERAYKDAVKYALPSRSKEEQMLELRILHKRALERVNKLEQMLSSDITSRMDALSHEIQAFMGDLHVVSREFERITVSLATRPTRVSLNTIPQTDKKPSSEGLTAVKYGGKWGYTNAAGTFIIPPVFDEAYAFVGGVAKVQHDGAMYTIDTTGRAASAADWEKPEWFSRPTKEQDATNVGVQRSANLPENCIRVTRAPGSDWSEGIELPGAPDVLLIVNHRFRDHKSSDWGVQLLSKNKELGKPFYSFSLDVVASLPGAESRVSVPPEPVYPPGSVLLEVPVAIGRSQKIVRMRDQSYWKGSYPWSVPVWNATPLTPSNSINVCVRNLKIER